MLTHIFHEESQCTKLLVYYEWLIQYSWGWATAIIGRKTRKLGHLSNLRK